MTSSLLQYGSIIPSLEPSDLEVIVSTILTAELITLIESLQP
jgi:hypothetical protein